MRLPTLTALTALAALSGMTGTSLANEEHVTFVESVRCIVGVCAVQKKTIPVLETVRTRSAGSPDLCVEYTKRLTGFKGVASLETAVSTRTPQFEESEKRYFRCAPDALLASS